MRTDYLLIILRFLILESRIFFRIRRFLGVTSKSSSVSIKSSACSRLKIRRRSQAECLISTGRTGVGQMLCLADIQLDIFCLTILSDDHSRINLFTCTNKESTTFLGTVKSVSYRLTGLECDQRSLLTVLDISFIWSISLKTCIDDTISLWYQS